VLWQPGSGSEQVHASTGDKVAWARCWGLPRPRGEWCSLVCDGKGDAF
jgi:hypothetical protein